MAKSKAQRKQEKKASMQEVKKEQEIKTQEKKQQEMQKQQVKEELATTKTPEKKHVGPEQVTLTMYTLIAMIVTFISAGVTAVAMVVYAKPISHLLKVTVGSTINEYSYEAVEIVIFEDYPNLPVYELYLAVAILVAVGAVLTVVGLIKAVNEYNKPNIVIAILGLVFAVAAIAVFIYADDLTREKIAEHGLPEQPLFGIYNLYLPFLITNIIGMLCNIFATAHGLKRWKKTGRTSK